MPSEFFWLNEATRARCFKTKDLRHSKINTYVICMITSFIDSEITALLHLTSFTEGVTSIGFHMPIWEIFPSFSDFATYFTSL